GQGGRRPDPPRAGARGWQGRRPERTDRLRGVEAVGPARGAGEKGGGRAEGGRAEQGDAESGGGHAEEPGEEGKAGDELSRRPAAEGGRGVVRRAGGGQGLLHPRQGWSVLADSRHAAGSDSGAQGLEEGQAGADRGGAAWRRRHGEFVLRRLR